jgi:multiple sugar transport system substrate-binding protein
MSYLRRKGQALFALLLLVAVTASACAPQATPTAAPTTAPEATTAPEPTAVPATTAPEPTAAPEPVELHMTWWGSQTRHDRTIAVIEMFMKEHPNIKVTYEFSGFGDYWPLLSTKAAAGELPDVIQQDYAYFTQYVSDGLLVPLDPFVADGTIDMSNVDPALNTGGMVDGKLYAVNLGTNSQSVAIDLELFEKAGVPLPKPDWTWKDFEDIALQIHDKLGIYGAAPGHVNDFQTWNTLYLSLGQGLYSDDGKALGFTDDEPLIDYFNMRLRLQEAGATVSREDEVANQYTLEKNPFVEGQAAMVTLHTNQLTALWTAAGEARKIKLFPMPRAVGATQPASFFKPSQFFSLTSHSKHPKEAAMLIDFFTNSVEANEILLAERGIPISSAVQEGILAKLPASQVEVVNFLKTLETSPIRPPDPAKHNELVTNVYGPQVVDAILYGQITPEEGVALLRKEATTILASQ